MLLAPRANGAMDAPSQDDPATSRIIATAPPVAHETAAGGVAPQVRQNKKWVLLDPPPCPSGGSGMSCEGIDQTQRWVEVDVFDTGQTLPPMVASGPAVPGGPKPPPAVSGTPGPVLSFNGVLATAVGGPVPPDTHMAVGTGLGASGRVVMVTNRAIQIWNKNGMSVIGPTPLTTFFPPAMGSTTFDPVVLFDQHMGRFFIVAISGTIPFTPASSIIRIARSTSATPSTLGAGDWTFASGAAGLVIGPSSTAADYPKIGADASALFVTTNQFPIPATGAVHSNIRIYDKATLTFVDRSYEAPAVFPPPPGTTSGATTINPAHVYGTTSAGHFYLINRFSATTYRLHWVTGHPGPGSTVVTTTFSPWTVGNPVVNPAPPPLQDLFADQCPTAPDVDISTLDARLQNAVWRNGNLYTTLTSDPDTDGESDVVWQQIAVDGDPGVTPPLVADNGFIDAAGTGWTYMPAIGVDNNDNVAIVFTESSTTLCPTVSYALREPALDGMGAFGATVTAFTSGGFYDHVGDAFSPPVPGTARWGDYAAMVSDPSEDCFWAAHEYGLTSAVDASLWGTRIVKFCTATTGACCVPPQINNSCANLTPMACAAIAGANFRGIGSSCPTAGVVPGMHSGVSTVHWAGSAVVCTNIVPREGDGGVASGLSNCCAPHPSPGCDDHDCQTLTCNLNSFCCGVEWVQSCADIAQQHCGQNLCTGGPQFLQPCVSNGDCPSAVCDLGPPLCEKGGGECVEGLKTGAMATSLNPGEESEGQVFAFKDFFDPGSDQYNNIVQFSGVPLGDAGPLGNYALADTIIDYKVEPYDRCALPGVLDRDIELVALNLVSSDPITVTYNGGQNPQLWDVLANCSDFAPSTGTMTITKDDCNSGTFTATFELQIKYTFTQVGNPGNVRILDTGELMFPSQTITVNNMPWSNESDFEHDSPWCIDFYAGVVKASQEPEECDCNMNLRRDLCDIEEGISEDCNLNGRPDECLCVASHVMGMDECEPDFDGDGVTDACDNCPMVSNSAQTDADGDGMGDVCDNCPNEFADIGSDGDGDRVDDAIDNCLCVPNTNQADSDGNGCGDACEPCAVDPPTVGDDTCQTAGADTGVPCSTNADCTPPAACGNKSRYISITPANAAVAGGTSIKVEIVSIPQFPSMVGDIYYAGAEVSVPNSPNPALRGAPLQCTVTPNSQTWTAGVLHLWGQAIVPGSTCNVRMCDAGGGNCSDPLLVATGKWGDVVRPFGGGSQPNFGDVSSIVAKFGNVASAPSTPRTDLVGPQGPGTPNTPNQGTNFSDVSNDVSAFSGFAYPYTVSACP